MSKRSTTNLLNRQYRLVLRNNPLHVHAGHFEKPQPCPQRQYNFNRLWDFLIWKKFKHAPKGTNLLLGAMQLSYLAALTLNVFAK